MLPKSRKQNKGSGKLHSTASAPVVSWICATLSLLLGIELMRETDNIGFPDGHRTEYERAIEPLLRYSVYIFGLFFIYFASMAGLRPALKESKFIHLLMLIIFIASVGMVFVGFPTYFGTYMNLENGWGG